jgi:methionine-rich copper-binding protein CopC
VVPASTHDALRSTNPADGATIDRLPDRVVLTFDQPALGLGSEVVVTGPAGPTSDGPPSLVDNEVRQPLRAGPAGRYTVVWRVTSADGHPVSGTFSFTTQQASTGPSSATSGSSTATTDSASTSGSSAATTAGTAPSPTAAAQPAASGSGSALVVVVVGIVGLLALGALGWWARRRSASR